MIQVEGLSIAYFGHPLFQGATFSIQKGERCGLVGRNGSGKSTLFRLITREETPDSGTISVGKNYTIGLLNQHIVFTKPTILEEAALGLRPAEQDYLYKVEKILFGLGFTESDLDKSPQSFSGGYQLRLHLAKVLISEPDCLLLDEPTNYLDIVSIRWFTRFLKQWRGEFILITHDREFMDSVSTHTLGIHRNKVRKIQGNTTAFFEILVQEEEVYERTRLNNEKKKERSLAFIERFGAKASKAAQAQSRQKMIDRIPALEKLKEFYNLQFEFKEASFFGKKLLDVQDVSFAYTPEGAPIVNNLSFSVEKGERIAIVGKNGRGKSTLLRLLAQELSPVSGSIMASEHLKIGYFGQTNIDRLHPKHTVEEEIVSGNPKLSITEARGICGLMMFSGPQAQKPISVLSGGERSRVLLGKIVGTPCNLLLLDEPTHHLDIESIEALVDALEDFQESIILVTHSELLLQRLHLDKIIVCHQGSQKVFLGGYDEFLEKDGWHDAIETNKEKASVKKAKQEADVLTIKAHKQTEQKFAVIEKEITQLELDQDRDNALLVQASQKKDVLSIQTLGKAIALRKKAIDDLYGQLEMLLQVGEHYTK